MFAGSGPAGCAPFWEPGRLLKGQGCLKCPGPRPVHSPPPPQGQSPANLRPLCEPSHVGRGRLPKTVFEHLLFPREASLKVTFEGRLGGWRRNRGASRGGLKALVAETLEEEIARREPWGHALLHSEVRGCFYNTLLLTLLSLFPEGGSHSRSERVLPWCLQVRSEPPLP